MQVANKQEIKAVASKVSRIYASTMEMDVTSDLELQHAADVLVLIKTNSKELKAKKKSILDPLSQAVSEIKSLFKEPEEQLAKAEATVKDAMVAYHDQKEAAARKEAERIERRLDKGTMKIDTGIAKLSSIEHAQTSINTEGGGVQFRQSAEKVRILNPAALPASYLTRERVLEALRLEVAADIKKGLPCPDGAEVYREKVAAGVVA